MQGIGAACLIGNSAAILTDAFPVNQRGLALGINNIAGISGVFIGLVLGGLLAPINWRLVFLVSVPFGLFGTVWAYLKLQERGVRRRVPIDWLGNLTFAIGLILVMIGITYGIEPYKSDPMGWTSPFVLSALVLGVAFLTAFALVEGRVENPMFRLGLFRIRAFTFGTLSSFLAAVGRGGLMFMLIIWLQGIWLPEHGYSFTSTPLWAGIYMIPLTVGFLLAGPLSGFLSDRFGSRPFATGGMIGAAASFLLPATAADRFSVSAVRADPLPQRSLDGRVRLTEPRGGHEQPASRRSRRRRRHERDLPELGAGALHRHLLHADDHRAVGDTVDDHDRGSRSARGPDGRGAARRPSATGVDPVCRVSRLQPDPVPGRCARALAPLGGKRVGADRSSVLPGV